MPVSILMSAQSSTTGQGSLAKRLKTGGDTIMFGAFLDRIEAGNAVMAIEAFELDRQG